MDQLKEQQELLWQFQLRRRDPAIPPDQLLDRAFFSQATPLQVVACTGCGTLYRNPCEAADELVKLYATEEPDPSVYQELFDAQRSSYDRQAELLTRMAGKAGRGLELGSYIGAFLSAARERGWHFHGVDVNAKAVEFARAKELTVWCGSLQDVPDEACYDAVAIWNCFDQLPDPRGVLAGAHLRLRPGGLIALRVPNGAFYRRLSGRRSRLAIALLAYNNLLAFPYRQGFTPTSIRALLGRSGFDVLKLRADVLVPTADRWTRRWARAEERMIKRALRSWPIRRRAPWFEVYARKSQSNPL